MFVVESHCIGLIALHQTIDRSQARNGRLCRVAVTDLGGFAPAITIIKSVQNATTTRQLPSTVKARTGGHLPPENQGTTS